MAEEDDKLVFHEFGPVWDENSRLLILGSFPSVKSREEAFYYAHPRNRFWKVLAAVAGGKPEEAPRTAEEKTVFLLDRGIAVWDVIDSCRIHGSSDSSIRDVKVNDIRPLLAGSRIGDRVFVNGGKAAQLYHRYIEPVSGIEAVQLPSTSPANAPWSLDRLIETWKVRIGYDKIDKLEIT